MRKEYLKVALLQIPLVWQNPKANRDGIAGYLDKLDSGVDLVVLPEMFNTGFTMDAASNAERIDGATVTWLKEMSSVYGLAICGSLIIEEGNHFYNRFVFVENGTISNSYDKRHLFRMADEHLTFAAGQADGVHSFEGWSVMNRVCYDLRFPVWSRSNAVDFQIYVANWPSPRIDAWSKLLMARAIENQCYVIGVNRIGEDENGMMYNGRSIVIDPKGNALTAEQNDAEGWVFAELSLPELESFREKFPLKLDADRFSIEY